MRNDRIKILYIAGEARSGSTILSNILGSIENYFNGGEIIDFWDRALNAPCTCGKSIDKCKFWSFVHQKHIENRGSFELSKIKNIKTDQARNLKFLKMFIVPWQTNKFKKEFNSFLLALNELYFDIKKAAKCKVLVDASKNVAYANLLRFTPGIDLYLIHFIRDPRGTANSWKTKKPGLWVEDTHSISLRWLLRNICGEMLGMAQKGRYIRIRYEDFSKRPKHYITLIEDMVEEKNNCSPFVSENEVYLTESHGIRGNPDRNKMGKIEIKNYETWKKDLDKKSRMIATFFTLPLLIKYGYPIWGAWR